METIIEILYSKTFKIVLRTMLFGLLLLTVCACFYSNKNSEGWAWIIAGIWMLNCWLSDYQYEQMKKTALDTIDECRKIIESYKPTNN